MDIYEVLEKYYQKFGEYPPRMNEDDETLAKDLLECINSGNEYIPFYEREEFIKKNGEVIV